MGLAVWVHVTGLAVQVRFMGLAVQVQLMGLARAKVRVLTLSHTALFGI